MVSKLQCPPGPRQDDGVYQACFLAPKRRSLNGSPGGDDLAGTKHPAKRPVTRITSRELGVALGVYRIHAVLATATCPRLIPPSLVGTWECVSTRKPAARSRCPVLVSSNKF